MFCIQDNIVVEVRIIIFAPENILSLIKNQFGKTSRDMKLAKYPW